MSRRSEMTSDVADIVRDLVVTVGKEIADGNPADLHCLLEVEVGLTQAWQIAIDGLRASGCGDPEIARALGITKQAVGQRWPRRSA